MKAVVATKTGGPDVLSLQGDYPDPTASPGHAIVKVEWAGVNFYDIYQRTGTYPAGGMPFVIGNEGSGTVFSLPSDYKGDVRVGDRVAFLAPAATAEYCPVPMQHMTKSPLPTRESAAVLLQGMTAAYLTHDTVNVCPGMVVLVHSAAGGTGALLAQMAKARGARVIGTVGSEDKAAIAGEYCDAVIVRSESVSEAVRRYTNGQGVDVVYDGVGKATFSDSAASIRKNGVLISYGSASGPLEGLNATQLRGFQFVCPTLFDYIPTQEAFNRLAGIVFVMIEQGKIRIKVHKEYPMERAGEAHADLEGGRTSGKLVIKVQ